MPSHVINAHTISGIVEGEKQLIMKGNNMNLNKVIEILRPEFSLYLDK